MTDISLQQQTSHLTLTVTSLIIKLILKVKKSAADTQNFDEQRTEKNILKTEKAQINKITENDEIKRSEKMKLNIHSAFIQL